MLSLLQPAFANVVVTNGAGQSVPAGSGSEEIIFLVFDEQGNPVTGVSVNFNLINPEGNSENDAMTVTIADTDVNGQVSTSFKGSATMGNYTITATLATDASQTDTTNLVVTDPPFQLTAIVGNGQLVTAGENSTNIVFELTDALGNVITNVQSVNFSMITPAGEVTNEGIFPQNSVTNVDGQTVVRLEPTDTTGDYTVTATLDTNNTVTGTTTITVLTPPPELPDLGTGVAMYAIGTNVPTTASFSGGTKVADATDFVQETELNASDSVFIRGIINVASSDVGKAADILVVAIYVPTGIDTAYFYMVGSDNLPKLWKSGDMADLVTFTRIESLTENLSVNMYGGLLPPGVLNVYFGYRLDDGTIVYNGSNSIDITIK
ncbi:hypothetical protein QUF74_11850 [Candidatus Halobeggiatoa sp. HSG11]|nr:hypothetical protein [Candidatus Halobeggiatoa sp. HSG11]